MQITKIETIWFDAIPDAAWRAAQGSSRQALPNNLWVQIHTDLGLVGLGETYYVPRATAAIVHDVFAPLLIGRDARDIENHWANMAALVSFCGAMGAEMRALSAIDIALWDLAGQNAGEPIYNMLGGRMRERIPVYNTCVGAGRYDDLNAWLDGRAGELAESLLAQGIAAMKIWPFDRFGPTLSGPAQSGTPATIWGAQTAAGVLGQRIATEDLKAGLAVVADIRRAVGDRMSIAIEGHARWGLPAATRIARALEPFDILWLEEIMPPDNVDSYVRLKRETSIPICQSERVFTRFGMRPWIEQGAADIIMPDLSWGGGLTEGRKIAAMADTHFLPVTCHDTIGPVALWAATHLMLHAPNALIMETVRAYIEGWYDDVVTDRIPLRDGHLFLPERAGLGTRLRPDLGNRPGANIEVSAA